MIYLLMSGRIGNQLFMYAAARTLQHIRGGKEEIVIDDTNNLKLDYINSLENYPLDNVRYVHDHSLYHSKRFILQRICIRAIRFLERNMTPLKKCQFEVKYQNFFNRLGLFYCENGVVPYPQIQKKDIVMWGYFQSENFFRQYKGEFIETYSLCKEVEKSGYPNLEQIRQRNTVCISVKVQHNVGSKMYDVCSDGYWESAIKYILSKVENPLFFLCSDNVEYVKEHLIDSSKYEIIEQDINFPVHISMAVMAQCKHYIIGNTSYGWWAQYLCQYPEKIVVAPSRWYGIEMPCDIYQSHWHLIEV